MSSSNNFYIQFTSNKQSFHIQFQEQPGATKDTVLVNGKNYSLSGDVFKVEWLKSKIPELQSHANLSLGNLETKLSVLGAKNIQHSPLGNSKPVALGPIGTQTVNIQPEMIDGKLHKVIMQHKDFSGSVLVAQKGKILHKGDYGRAALQNTDNEVLVYRWCSITKTITATAVLQLMKNEDLDKPITEYLKEYSDATKYPGLVNVTIRELLSHTSKAPDHCDYLDKLTKERLSGIKDSQQQIELKRKIEEEYFLKRHEPKDMVENLMSLPLKDKPHDYNNFAFTLLGLLVEKVSGQSYAEYVKKNIFEPAGMTTARVATSREDDRPTIAAEGFYLNEKGATCLSRVDDPLLRFASGNINGSTMDLYQFDRALKNGVLLRSDQLQDMQTQFLGFDPLAPREIAGEKVIAKTGGMDGLRTIYEYFPNQDTTFVFLGNSDLEVYKIAADSAASLFQKARAGATEIEVEKNPSAGATVSVDDLALKNQKN